MNVKAMQAPLSRKPRDRRWVLICEDTGEIVDDAQGYGYRSPQKAYAAWNWKNRSPETKSREAAARKAVRRFLETEVDVEDLLDQMAWDREPGERGMGRMADRMLQEMGYRDLPFTGAELLLYR